MDRSLIRKVQNQRQFREEVKYVDAEDVSKRLVP